MNLCTGRLNSVKSFTKMLIKSVNHVPKIKLILDRYRGIRVNRQREPYHSLVIVKIGHDNRYNNKLFRQSQT